MGNQLSTEEFQNDSPLSRNMKSFKQSFSAYPYNTFDHKNSYGILPFENNLLNSNDSSLNVLKQPPPCPSIPQKFDSTKTLHHSTNDIIFKESGPIDNHLDVKTEYNQMESDSSQNNQCSDLIIKEEKSIIGQVNSENLVVACFPDNEDVLDFVKENFNFAHKPNENCKNHLSVIFSLISSKPKIEYNNISYSNDIDVIKENKETIILLAKTNEYCKNHTSDIPLYHCIAITIRYKVSNLPNYPDILIENETITSLVSKNDKSFEYQTSSEKVLSQAKPQIILNDYCNPNEIDVYEENQSVAIPINYSKLNNHESLAIRSNHLLKPIINQIIHIVETLINEELAEEFWKLWEHIKLNFLGVNLVKASNASSSVTTIFLVDYEESSKLEGDHIKDHGISKIILFKVDIKINIILDIPDAYVILTNESLHTDIPNDNKIILSNDNREKKVYYGYLRYQRNDKIIWSDNASNALGSMFIQLKKFNQSNLVL